MKVDTTLLMSAPNPGARSGLPEPARTPPIRDMPGRKDLKKELTGMSSTTLEPTRAIAALQGSPIPAVRRLVLEENETRVVLRGQVTTYYQKQMAQEAVKPVLGRRLLLNQVEVVPN